MQIENEEQAAYLSDIRIGKWPMAAMLFVATDPDVMYTVLHSRSIGPAWNTAQYRNPNMDQLLDQGRVELDQTKRATIYAQAQMLVAQEVPYIPYYNIQNAHIVNARFRDFQYDTQGFWRLYDTWAAS